MPHNLINAGVSFYWVIPALIGVGGDVVIGKDSLLPIGVAAGIVVSAFLLGKKLQQFIDEMKQTNIRLASIESKVSGLTCVRHPEWANKIEQAILEQKGK